MNRFVRAGAQHLHDTTMSVGSTFPVFAALETLVLGMSVDVSMKSKVWAAGLSYAGIGFAFVRGRDKSRKIFGIVPETKGWKKGMHDYLYAAAFNLVVGPIIYKASGGSWEEAFKGTGMAMLMSGVTGPIAGYAVDAGRDLTGVLPPNEEMPQRLPQYVRSLPKRVKQALYPVAVAAVLGLTGLVYLAAPGKKPVAPAPLEQRVEQHYQK